MNVSIPYGRESINVSCEASCQVLLPNSVALPDQSKVISEALDHPLGTAPFSEFARGSDKLLVIVNDATRPTPTSKVLAHLSGALESHPDVTFLVATGTHRAPTEEERRFILGDLYEPFRDRMISHDSRKDEDMVYLGRSKGGTEMYINRLVPDTRNILVIGSVEPHYFAGYTGGRKSFLPGVASYRTIEMNHRAALSSGARALALDGNPVHDDMTDAMAVLNDLNVFSIQTVLTGDHQIYAVTAGDLFASFDAAIEKANQVFCVGLERRGNVVVTAAPYPMDIDLYQSQKALDNGKLALEDGGIIILISKCRDGVGDDAFLRLLASADTPEEVLALIDRGYRLGYHKAAKMVEIARRARMWGVSDLPDQTMRDARLEPQPSIQAALDKALAAIRSEGKEPHVVFMPAGSLTVPVIK